jgi:hypothetical protein
MRTFFAICLILMFLLYNAGYYIFYLTVNEQYDASWKEKVEDNQLDPTILQTRSIPITFAYQADQKEFQPVLEVFEMDGKQYRILQQRYAKDTLHIVYINDQAGNQMKNSLRDWVNTLSQKPSSSKSTTVWDGFEKNYMPNHLDFSLIVKPNIDKEFRIFISSEFISPYIDTLTPPPKA